MGQWFLFWLNPFCLQPMPLACLCSLHASCVCFHSCPKHMPILLTISHALNGVQLWLMSGVATALHPHPLCLHQCTLHVPTLHVQTPSILCGSMAQHSPPPDVIPGTILGPQDKMHYLGAIILHNPNVAPWENALAKALARLKAWSKRNLSIHNHRYTDGLLNDTHLMFKHPPFLVDADKWCDNKVETHDVHGALKPLHGSQ